jgi:UDP-glucose 4-epimerase
MKILVSGGAGFIGSHVVDAFLEDGNEVAVVDNLETGSRENVPAAAHFELLDLREADRLREWVLDFAPDAVFHHAAQISVPASVSDPAFDASVNIVGSLNLWQSARDAGASRFVFASSGGAIYGDNPNLPLSEREIPAPTSPYGLSKQVFEMYLAQMARFGGPTPVILRYANVYGPRQGARGEAGVISIWARLLLENQPCTITFSSAMLWPPIARRFRAALAVRGTSPPRRKLRRSNCSKCCAKRWDVAHKRRFSRRRARATSSFPALMRAPRGRRWVGRPRSR